MLRLCIVFILASLLGLFLQGTLIHGAFPTIVVPDLVLVLIVIIAQRYRTVPALLGVFSLGILSDFASGRYVGPNAAAAVIAFAIVGAIAKRVYAEHGVAFCALTFLCSLAKSTTVMLLIGLYTDPEAGALFEPALLRRMLYEALFTSLFAPLMYKLIFSGLAANARERSSFGKSRGALARSRPSYDGLRE